MTQDARTARVGDWFVPCRTSQHWLIVLIVYGRTPAQTRLVCFRNGVRRTFSPWERA